MRIKTPDIEFPLEFATSLIEAKRLTNPKGYYFAPNQDLNYLLNAYDTMKAFYEKPVSDVLFIGGSLYSGVIKGYEKSLGNRVNVDLVELEPRALITQLYILYCIKNNGTHKSTMNHLLLDEFINSPNIKSCAQYSGKRISGEFTNFKKFINGSLSDERAFELFNHLFNLNKAGDDYVRGLPSMDSNPSIINSIFHELSFKPSFPDNAYNIDALLASKKCDKSYDLILSNNVFELTLPIMFFKSMSELLNDGGLLEVTILRANKSIDYNYFSELLTISSTGCGRNVYSLFDDSSILSKPVSLNNRVKVLKKN